MHHTMSKRQEKAQGDLTKCDVRPESGWWETTRLSPPRAILIHSIDSKPLLAIKRCQITMHGVIIPLKRTEHLYSFTCQTGAVKASESFYRGEGLVGRFLPFFIHPWTTEKEDCESIPH